MTPKHLARHLLVHAVCRCNLPLTRWRDSGSVQVPAATAEASTSVRDDQAILAATVTAEEAAAAAVRARGYAEAMRATVTSLEADVEVTPMELERRKQEVRVPCACARESVCVQAAEGQQGNCV